MEGVGEKAKNHLSDKVTTLLFAAKSHRAILVIFCSILDFHPLQQDAEIETSLIILISSFIIAAPIPIILLLSTRSLRVHLPSGITTLRDLTKDLEVHHPTLGGEKLLFTKEQIAHSIKGIVIEQLGIKEELYSEDARFIEDLGVG